MDTYMYDKEYFSSMHELKILLEDYHELTPYQLIYEANKPDVSNQMQKNANIKQNSEGVIMKAIHAVQKIIKNIISSIQDFFDKLTMGKDEKVLYQEMQTALQQNPELKNKKLTVKDFRTISQKYDTMINDLEGEIRNCAANHKPPAQELMDKITNFLKEGVAAGTAILGTEVAVKAARSNIGMAKLIKKQLRNHNVIIEQLTKILGEADARKFTKEIDKDARLLGAHRLLVNLRAKKFENLRECIMDTLGQLQEISQGKIFGNIGLVKRFAGNKTFKPVVKEVGKVAATTYADRKIGSKVRAAKAKAEQWMSKNVVNRGHDPAAKSAREFMMS